MLNYRAEAELGRSSTSSYSEDDSSSELESSFVTTTVFPVLNFFIAVYSVFPTCSTKLLDNVLLTFLRGNTIE